MKAWEVRTECLRTGEKNTGGSLNRLLYGTVGMEKKPEKTKGGTKKSSCQSTFWEGQKGHEGQGSGKYYSARLRRGPWHPQTEEDKEGKEGRRAAKRSGNSEQKLSCKYRENEEESENVRTIAYGGGHHMSRGKGWSESNASPGLSLVRARFGKFDKKSLDKTISGEGETIIDGLNGGEEKSLRK